MTELVGETEFSSIYSSRPVRSPQNGIHPGLLRLIKRHQENEYRRPLSQQARKQIESLNSWVKQYQGQVVLDNGCGTGISTYFLSGRYPKCAVIGLDKSEHRLARVQSETRANIRFLCVDVIDFLPLAKDLNWKVVAQYFLYPNPWPKREHIQRRWHGHPVFHTIMQLGGEIEMRTNWRIYAQEFALALRQYGVMAYAEKYLTTPNNSVSLFEKKYAASGHSLYRVHCMSA